MVGSVTTMAGVFPTGGNERRVPVPRSLGPTDVKVHFRQMRASKRTNVPRISFPHHYAAVLYGSENSNDEIEAPEPTRYANIHSPVRVATKDAVNAVQHASVLRR